MCFHPSFDNELTGYDDATADDTTADDTTADDATADDTIVEDATADDVTVADETCDNRVNVDINRHTAKKETPKHVRKNSKTEKKVEEAKNSGWLIFYDVEVTDLDTCRAKKFVSNYNFSKPRSHQNKILWSFK